MERGHITFVNTLGEPLEGSSCPVDRDLQFPGKCPYPPDMVHVLMGDKDPLDGRILEPGDGEPREDLPCREATVNEEGTVLSPDERTVAFRPAGEDRDLHSGSPCGGVIQDTTISLRIHVARTPLSESCGSRKTSACPWTAPVKFPIHRTTGGQSDEKGWILVEIKDVYSIEGHRLPCGIIVCIHAASFSCGKNDPDPYTNSRT